MKTATTTVAAAATTTTNKLNFEQSLCFLVRNTQKLE